MRSSRDKMRGCGGSGSGAEADLVVFGSLYVAVRFLGCFESWGESGGLPGGLRGSSEDMMARLGCCKDGSILWVLAFVSGHFSCCERLEG
jgi:hypothetical protein